MTTVRTILVPIDFSEGSFAALRHARELASIFHSQLHLLHVATGPDAPLWAAELFGSHLRPRQEQERIAALDRLATLIVAQGLDPFTTTGLVRMGCPERVIADYANEVRADLVIMGVHGHHSPMISVGRVVERVLASVSCPVLTIPEQRVAVDASEAPRELVEALAC